MSTQDAVVDLIYMMAAFWELCHLLSAIYQMLMSFVTRGGRADILLELCKVRCCVSLFRRPPMFRTIGLAIILLAALALLTLAAEPSRADPTSAPDDSVTGVFGEGAPTQAQPSKTGAMRWTYPFELPGGARTTAAAIVLDL
jgi:hypothetical protein